MECMQVLDPKGLVEEKFSLDEVSVGEHMNKEMDGLDERMQTKEEKEITSIRNTLHHYKAQNTSDHFMSENRMIRQDLEEINANYAEMVQVAEEEVKRRIIYQETNGKLLKQNQELQEKVPAIEKELS